MVKTLLLIFGLLAIGVVVDQLALDGENSRKLVLNAQRIFHAAGNAGDEVGSSILT